MWPETTLKEALETANPGPARLTLVGGKIVLGRIIRIDDEALSIRRPSGGLRTISLSDIEKLGLKTTEGDLLTGRITRLADGGIGWAPAATTGEPGAQVAGSKTPGAKETGGPLIRIAKLPPATVADDAAAASEDETDLAALTPENAAPDAAAPSTSPVRLEVTTEGASENDKLLYFHLSLSEPAPQPILVIYTMIDGTARSPGDYGHRQGVVIFDPGQTKAKVAATIVDDNVSEDPESLQFFVSGDPSTLIIERRTIAATIEDDDG